MGALLPSGISGCCSSNGCITVPVETLIDEEIERLLTDFFLVGHGSPEGVRNGAIRGQIYTDEDTGSKYTFLGVIGQNTGWV